LPNLAEAGSLVAVERSLEGILQRPYLAKVYSYYLWRLARSNEDICVRFEAIFRDNDFSYYWQIMWPIAAFLTLDGVSPPTVTKVMRILQDYSYSVPLRAICAIFVG